MNSLLPDGRKNVKVNPTNRQKTPAPLIVVLRGLEIIPVHNSETYVPDKTR